MLRSIAFLVMTLFTFSLFSPVLQPQTAEADCYDGMEDIGEQIENVLNGIKHIYKIIKSATDAAKKCKSLLKKKCDACGKEIGAGNDKCDGPLEKCDGENWTPKGCNDWNYPCQSNHSTIHTCKNKRCKQHGENYLT